jgi:hypothetical protein
VNAAGKLDTRRNREKELLTKESRKGAFDKGIEKRSF